MVAQRIYTNEAVHMSEEATVQTITQSFSRQPALLTYRWVCETCGMIHSGSAPTSCESCGNDLSHSHQNEIRCEMGSRR